MDRQEKVRKILNEVQSPLGWIYRGFLVFLVTVVCVTFVWETYPISERTRMILEGVDTAVTVIFLIDYLVRFWSERFRIRYLFTPLAIVDLLAILPLFLSAQWQFVRILRLFRILRLLRVLQRRRPKGWIATEYQMRLATILFTLFAIIFISAGLIYDLEHEHNPEQIRTFFDALYFAVVSMTTVGYGDILPVTTQGRVATLVMIASGMVLVPYQLTQLIRYLVQSGLKHELECKGCGQEWHEPAAHYCMNCGHKLERLS